MNQLREESELVRAHDMIAAVIRGETPAIPMDHHTMTGLCAAADVLCWALHHEHNQRFAENLRALERALAGVGRLN